MKTPKDIDFNKLTFEERIRYLESQGADWKKPPAQRRNPKSYNRPKPRNTSHSTAQTQINERHWKDEHPDLLSLLDDLYREIQRQAESRFKPSEVRQTDFDQSLEKIIEAIVLYCCRTNLDPAIFRHYVSNNYHGEICKAYADYQEFQQVVKHPEGKPVAEKSLTSTLVEIVRKNEPIQARKVVEIYLNLTNKHISKQLANKTLYAEVRSGNLIYNQDSFEYSVGNRTKNAVVNPDAQSESGVHVNKLIRIGKLAHQLGQPISLIVEVLRTKGHKVNANSKVTRAQYEIIEKYFDQLKRTSEGEDKSFEEYEQPFDLYKTENVFNNEIEAFDSLSVDVMWQIIKEEKIRLGSPDVNLFVENLIYRMKNIK